MGAGNEDASASEPITKDPPGLGSRLGLAAAVLAIAVGVVGRVVRFLDGRSLWLDEATLALNVLDRSFAELARPLDRNQVASLPFLWLQKTATLCFGDGERALRVVPFVTGLLALAGFWFLARRWFSRGPALLAISMFALSDSLMFYCAEAKQYSLDVLSAVVVLLVGESAWRRGLDPRRAAVVAAVLVVAMLVSQPAVFVVAAFLLASWLRRGRRREERMALFALAGVLGASFALNYLWFLRPAAQNEMLGEYWSADFVPLPGDWAALQWFPRHLFGYFNDPGAWPACELAAWLFTVGVIARWREDRARGVLLLAPFVLMLGAAALRLYPFPGSMLNDLAQRIYPFVGRTLLFSLPAAILGMTAGVQALRGRSSGEGGALREILAATAVAILLFTPAVQALHNTLDPPRVQEMRPLYERVRPQMRPGDWVFAQTFAGPVLEYYQRRAGAGMEEGQLLRPIPASTTSEEGMLQFHAALARLGSGQRLWLFSLHHPRWASRQEQQELAEIFRRMARPLELFEEFQASAILFETNSAGE